MAKKRQMPKVNSKTSGATSPEELKAGQGDCLASKTAEHPGPNDDKNETQKLPEAIGGIPAAKNEHISPSEDIKKGVASSCFLGSSAADCEKPEVDTKSGCRPPPKVYRSLSQNTGEDFKKLGTAHSDDRKHKGDKKFSISLNEKPYNTSTWCPELADILGDTSLVENPSKRDSGQTNIRLGQSASSDLPEERNSGQTNVGLNHAPNGHEQNGIDQPIYQCSDVGHADSAISGYTEDLSHPENVPLIEISNNQEQQDYKRIYADVRKKAKNRHKQRMTLRTESDCLPGTCFHPEQKHDWSSHEMQKKQIYNYSAVRTGHIFQREGNTNRYKECGTCCHIGDRYILTCYHCIERALCQQGWQNEWCLQQDLTVTFPDVSTLLPRSKPRQYRFEPYLHAYSEDLDFALLRLDHCNLEQIPPCFTRHTDVNGDQEHPVYIAGYQLHPEHKYGKLVVDASALKFPIQALNLQFVEGWSKILKEKFEVNIKKLFDGMCPWKGTYYPITRCGQNFPVLSSLIRGASGGFGLTYADQDDQLPVVNFMFRAGYPNFYYNSHFNDSNFCDDHQYIQNNFRPCWTFQEGVPIGTIVEEIRKSPNTSFNTIPFLMPNI